MSKYSKIIVKNTVKEILDFYKDWHTQVFNNNPDGVFILETKWNKYKNSYKLLIVYECDKEVN